ncbi:MAG: DUF2177 family protein [Legionella sp.]
MSFLKLFILALITLVVIDSIWLGLIAKSLYFKHYGSWLRLAQGELQLNWWAAALVYLLMALALVVFVLPIVHQSAFNALLYGAILGAVLYGVYNFTCLAIFKDWPVSMAFVDWAWGTVLLATSALITHYAARALS